MRAYKLAGLAATVALGMAVCSTARADLVTNGGFETGDFTGWVQSGNTGFSGVQCPGPGPDVAEGNCSAFFGPVGSDAFLSQAISTTLGQRYLFSFSFETDGGTPSEFSASFGGVTLVSLTNPPASSGFITESFNVFGTGLTSDIEFSFRDDPGFILFDAVSVQVPEPGSLTLFGAGLVAAFLTARRAKRRRRSLGEALA